MKFSPWPIFFVFLSICFPAQAEPVPFPGEADTQLPKRLALVIGVENYQNSSGLYLRPLPDAAQDARAIAAFLPQLGFEKPQLVIGTDSNIFVTKNIIEAAIDDFIGSAKKAKDDSGRLPVLLVYFSGHGFSVDGASYLIPSDLYATNLSQFKTSSVPLLEDIVLRLQNEVEPALQIIITDACRTPTPATINAAPGTKDLISGTVDPNHGRAAVKTELGKNRSLFLYSTLDGNPAFGTAGAGGRFTNALKSALSTVVARSAAEDTSRVSIREVFDRAKFEMDTAVTGKWQKPLFDDSFGSSFYLLPTVTEFKLERASYDSTTLDAGVSARAAWDRRVCNLREMLFQISEYSYYSQRVIDEMFRPPAWGPLDCAAVQSLGGGQIGAAAPASKDAGKWNVPSLSGPSALPSQVRSQTGQRGERLQRGIDGWRIASELQIGRIVPAAELTTPAPAPSGRSSNVFAQLSTPDSSTGGVTVQKKPDFGDAATAISQSPLVANAPPIALPPPDVPLDQAVVAKVNLFLREMADPQSPPKAVIPAGEFLQVMSTSPGRTWLLVKHASLGSGYVSGDLIEAALMKLSKLVTFQPNQFELDENAKIQLLGAYGLLGGVAIVDAVAEYPDTDGTLGFARASGAAKFVSDVATPHEPNRKSQLYIAVRASKDKASVAAGSVRMTILGLPLDRKTRAALAQVYQSGTPINLDIVKSANPADPSRDPDVDLRYCNSLGGACSTPKLKADTVDPLKVELGKALTGGADSQPLNDVFRKLQPLVKF
ncbi:caspase family protein [Bradyrhizobium sp. USDA 4502]